MKMNTKKVLKIKFSLLAAALAATLILAGCEEASEEEPEPDENGVEEENGAEQLEDGTYTAVSEADERGYAEAEVTIADGEITEVSLKEYDDLGEQKDEDYGYDVWHEAMEELPERFVEANSADIDVYTDATSTSEKSMDAVDKALQRAEGYTDTFDGTFMGASEVGEQGYVGIALVTLQNGEITEVDLGEADEEGEFKDEDYDYEPWVEAAEEMPERFVEADSPEVDVYTDATSSSEKWKEAVERAIEKAEQ